MSEPSFTGPALTILFESGPPDNRITVSIGIRT